MFINKPKYLFKRLVRTADFPMFQDMGGQLSNRGLQWTRFQEGSFANSKLPEDMVQQISLTRSVFNESFSKFFTKTPEAFRGMIFTVYAPNFIGDDLSAYAKL